MTIWNQEPNLERINTASEHSMAGHLGIQFLEFGDDYLTARMPVDERTVQPWGNLHGGASAAFAETLGSVGGNFAIDPEEAYVVGMEINVNHIRPIREGWVFGTARPFHVGRTTQVWEIKITDQEERLISVSRLTLAVRPLPAEIDSPFLTGRSNSSST